MTSLWLIYLVELRPVTKQSIRLDPIGNKTGSQTGNKTKRPRGSANDRLERIIKEFEKLAPEQRHTLADKLAHAIEKVNSQSEAANFSQSESTFAQISNSQRETLLSNCAEVLELAELNNDHVSHYNES